MKHIIKCTINQKKGKNTKLENTKKRENEGKKGKWGKKYQKKGNPIMENGTGEGKYQKYQTRITW